MGKNFIKMAAMSTAIVIEFLGFIIAIDCGWVGIVVATYIAVRLLAPDVKTAYRISDELGDQIGEWLQARKEAKEKEPTMEVIEEIETAEI